MSFSGKDLVHLERAIESEEIITSDERRLLMKYSAKLSLDDILSSVEESNLLSIIAKISRPESIDIIGNKLSSKLVSKIRLYGEKCAADNENICQAEKNTGLLAVAINEKYEAQYTYHYSDSAAFFFAEKVGGSVVISFNKSHIYFDEFEKLRNQNSIVFQLVLDLVHSWGICEIENQSAKERLILSDAREMWGRRLRGIIGARNGF